MSSFYNLFSGLATFSGFICFVLGFGFAYLVECVRAKLKHRAVKIPWHLAGIAIGTAAIIIVTFQSSAAYNTANETAAEVQTCQREFNTILRARSQIAEENDALSVVQRTALGDWLKAIVFPPPDIAQLRSENPNDPKVQEWGIQITIRYSNIIQQAQAEQNANFQERKQHPLPAPTCGN